MNEYFDKMMKLLSIMGERDASDLHLSVGVCPYLRIHGKMTPTEFPVLSNEECEKLLFSLLTEEGRTAFNVRRTLDFSLGYTDMGRFRINIYQQRGTLAAAIRRLPIEIPDIAELGLPAETVKKFCNRSQGLILVTGPVGSGKTTTLASIIDYINKNRNLHIISIEDPVEYVHKNVKSVIHQREIGRDTPNFVDALKYVLREDPDVVLVGEMRDLETIATTVTIAETGHLVLATLHTGDTAEAVRRIVDVFPGSQQHQILAQLSCTLAGVVNQMLLPRIDKPGRILAAEVLVANSAIQNLIRENKIEQFYSHLQMGSEYGMKTMNQSLFELVKAGKISKELALLKSTRVKELAKLLEM